MRAKLHNEETQIREKMKVLQKASEAQLAKTQQKMNILQTENTRLKREVQMCPPTETLFGPGQSVTVGKCHCSHAYLL